MSARSRLFIVLVLAYVLGVGALLWWLVRDIDPRYRESAEESLVETAHLMASLIEQTSPDGSTIDVELLEPLFKSVYARNVGATVFGIDKPSVELRLYVTDAKGIVLFDSQERNVGKDYSRWRDVKLTLQGEYGARTSPDIDDDPLTSVMIVGAPIRLGNGIAGVVSAGKPVQSLNQYVTAARRKTLIVGATSALAALLLAALAAVWLARPLVRDFMRYVRAQRKLSLPSLTRRAWHTVGAAYGDVRDALTGRDAMGDYVQTLTHELKSPLAAIRGSAELLQDPAMPSADRVRFLGHIERETERIQETVDRMMELTRVESLRTLERRETVALRPLLQELADGARVRAAARSIELHTDIDRDARVLGDAFLLRRAVSNLLDNALEFAPDDTRVDLVLAIDPTTATVQVRDRGPGIPAYAQSKVFDRFYSLARPGSQKKSTGLGLPFVKEVAALHDAKVSLVNADGGGALASLKFERDDG